MRGSQPKNREHGTREGAHPAELIGVNAIGRPKSSKVHYNVFLRGQIIPNRFVESINV